MRLKRCARDQKRSRQAKVDLQYTPSECGGSYSVSSLQMHTFFPCRLRRRRLGEAVQISVWPSQRKSCQSRRIEEKEDKGEEGL
jgi:hypothetical protein